MDLCLKLLTLGFVISSVTELVLSDESQQFKEQTAIEGTSYKMKCTSGGSHQGQEPSLSSSSTSHTIVIWSVNGHLPRGPKYKLLTDGLVIRNVSKNDTFANYTCTVLDRFSFTPMNSENIRLKLRQREGKLLDSNNLIGSATEKNVKVWGIVNQWVKLQCNVLSRPMPTFEWRSEQSREKIRNTTNVFKIIESEFTSNLTVFIHNETFFRKYICEASNEHGSVTQYFVLSEGYKPKSPFIYPVFIGKDKLTLKVEPQETFRNKGGATMSPKEKLPIANYFIQYTEAASLSFAPGELDDERLNGKKKKWTTVVNTMSADGLSPYITKQEGGIFELRNLKENMTYLVRCAVANAAAVSDFSTAIRITTEPERTVSATSNTLDTKEDKVPANRKEDYGKSPSYKPEKISSALMNNTFASPTSSNHGDDCKTWRYKKTIIKTTTITTMIENLIDAEDNNVAETPSLAKKFVDENTSIDRMYLCSI